MGGDHAPERIVAGAVAAAEAGTPVLLVGDPEALGDDHGLPVKPASQVIGMDADPAVSVRRMKDASVVRAAEAVRDGEAAAMLSAGNTGAAMAASLLRIGRIKGIARPAIAVPFPAQGRDTPTALLDCGANADCTPEMLRQFGQLGAMYLRTRWGVAEPRIGLLTIGEEAGKGNALIKETSELLESDQSWATSIGAVYAGNVEGRDLMYDVVDVMVCDGFVGNVVLKALEGGVGLAFDLVRRVLNEGGRQDVVRDLQWVFDELDPDARGSAALLGTRGVSLISHGSSTQRAITNAIHTAAELSRLDLVDSLRTIVEAPS